jgi:Protein of unknown function (DUF3106)
MMRRRKFEGCLLALIISAGLASSCFAQRPEHPPKPQQESRQVPRAGAHPQNATPGAQRREQRREQEPMNRGEHPYSGSANADREGRNQNRFNANRPAVNRGAGDPNRPPASQYSRGAENNYGAYRGQQRLSPEERQRVLQNQQRFRQLSPQQQQDMRDRSRVWQHMTPQQRDHIKNDVLPTWRNLPPQRQKAIEQRLGVLQNMPESARNQHLNDPNFTRGMSDEDRATLHDLSHLHVGGAPDPPKE